MKSTVIKIILLMGSLFLLMACSKDNHPNNTNPNSSQILDSQQSNTNNKVDIINRDNAIPIVPSKEEDTSLAENQDTTSTSRETSQVETSETEETSNEDTLNQAQGEVFDPKIYDLDLIQLNNKNQINIKEFVSVEEIINYVLDSYGADRDSLSIAYYNFQSEEHFYLNEDQLIVAASTAKVPAAMAYIDLINQGVYSFDTPLLYNDYYNIEGNGNITNSPSQVNYTIADLLHEAIVYSDNTAWYTLVFNYPNNFGGIASYILDSTGFYDVPEYFWMDNYASAYLYEQLLIKVATQSEYEYLVNLMKQTDPPQLFTSYINTEVLANKYGRVDEQVNDIGIYYENNQPQYILTVFTDNIMSADHILEDLSLYVNLWFRHNFIL